MPTKKPAAPRAEYATKPVTPLMQEFCDWIEREVGVKLDAEARRAVYLGSALRTEFQKANAAAKQTAPSVPAKRAPRKAATETEAVAAKPAPKPRAKRGSTIATAEGVVIAEQKHVEVA